MQSNLTPPVSAPNRWSAVKCLEAKHDPSLAKRAPAAVSSADGDAAGPSKPAQKPTPNSVAGQIAGIMGGMLARSHDVSPCAAQGCLVHLSLCCKQTIVLHADFETQLMLADKVCSSQHNLYKQ